ncbi:MAG: OprD family outer membrane porin [Campylobacterota bacterium]|nr:OprD family outer membrane porin [Campylobacterota bacterium]
MKLSYSKTLLLALLPVVGTSLNAAESLVQTDVPDADHAYETVTHTDEKKDGYLLGDGWKVTGDMRIGYVNYDYSNDPENFNPNTNKGHKDSKGIYFIPKISITSPEYNGFSFKITGGGVTDFGINDEIYESRTFAFGDGSSYAILQEAYVKYVNNGHIFLAGNYELSTPMVDADDWYLFANTFQGAYYKNTTIENIAFAGGYVYKMAGVWDGGAADAHRFHSIADQSYVDQRDKDNAGDAGMWAAMFNYEKDEHNFQIWDYYAVDLYNTLFAQYDYTGKFSGGSYVAGAQLINFKDVGGNTYTPIDYSIYSLRFDGKFDNGFDLSTGAAFYTDGPGVGATLGAWGGYPYLANGMIFHFFEAGDLTNANSYKAQVGYDLGKQGVEGLWVGARYTYFDLDPTYSISSSNGEGQDYQQNYGLRVSYNHPDGYYFTGTYEYVDLDQQDEISALRLIGGYKF